MVTENNNIAGLRAQILGSYLPSRLRTWLLTEVANWCYAHPDKTSVVVINTFMFKNQYGSHPSLQNYQAIIAEDRREGNRIFLRSGHCGTLEAALGVLVDLTGFMVEDVLRRRIVEPEDGETSV
jgi:hypothetical protein